MRAVTAKTVENLPHGLGTGMKHDDYPPGYGGSSALLDTYLQYIGENMFGTLFISKYKDLKQISNESFESLNVIFSRRYERKAGTNERDAHRQESL